ncbi:MAG TPA: hypothetical protein VMT26_04780 [Candidatus Bathyarchaeia archaeon]|nr:hypothetical protein [Candidatus Bathyarchaeia archaeon]
MAENTIRCKMKWGDAEFEIEGGVDKELKEKINELYEIFKQAIADQPESTQKKHANIGKDKKSIRHGGGRKPPFYRGNIQRIIEKEPEWFVDRSVEEVASKLKTEYGVPGANEKPVGTALTRLFQKNLLTRKEADGKYLYSVTSLEETKK